MAGAERYPARATTPSHYLSAILETKLITIRSFLLGPKTRSSSEVQGALEELFICRMFNVHIFQRES